MKRNTKLLLIGGSLAVFVIIATVWSLSLTLSHRDVASNTAANTDGKGRKVLYWHDPMVPGFKSDRPGKSPFMDMQLVPVYDDEQGSSSVAGGRTPGATDEQAGGTGRGSMVSIRPEVVQNMGVRTHTVTRGGQVRRITASGFLFQDEKGLAVLADVFDSAAAIVRSGLTAEVRVADLPGKSWNGVVEHLESDVGIGARAVKIRVRLRPSATNGLLKPNMFAEVTIEAGASGGRAILVPREAVIRTGTRTSVVVALGGGRFQPVEILPGAEFDDWIEVTSGIKEGDVVVTSGQFLIDSEASVRGSFSRMQSSDPAATDAAPSKDKQ